MTNWIKASTDSMQMPVLIFGLSMISPIIGAFEITLYKPIHRFLSNYLRSEKILRVVSRMITTVIVLIGFALFLLLIHFIANSK
jgi:hypothetical protein